MAVGESLHPKSEYVKATSTYLPLVDLKIELGTLTTSYIYLLDVGL